MARHSRTSYIVYPPMYRAGDEYFKVYSMYQAKKIIHRCYNRGYPGGLGWEVWRWRSTKGRADELHHSITSGFDGVVFEF